MEILKRVKKNGKYSQRAGIITNTIQEIVDLNSMQTKSLPDGSVWARIHWLDVVTNSSATNFFTTAEVQDCEAENRYSKMKFIEKFKSSKVTLTNLVKPIAGTSNFSSSFATAGSYVKYASSNSLLLTGTTSNVEVTATSSYSIYFNPNHTYYGTVEVLQETKQGGIDLYWPVREPRVILGSTAPAATKCWGKVSGVRTAATFKNHSSANASLAAGNYTFRLDYNNSSTTGQTWYDGLMIIDLTEAFGEGNEPTQAWCDANIPYFTGTREFDFPNSGYGKYEFMLTYPRLSNTLYNRWSQTGSPNSSAPTGYLPITTAWSAHAGPLRKHGSACVYNCDNAGSSTWYAPIGQTVAWTSTQAIPGANGVEQTETELWVRIDNIAGVTGTSGIYKQDNVLMSNFYEL